MYSTVDTWLDKRARKQSFKMLAAADYRTYGRCKEVRKRRLMGMEKRDGTINWMP